MLIVEKTFPCSMFSQSVSLKMLHMVAFPKGMMVCVCVCVCVGVCVCVSREVYKCIEEPQGFPFFVTFSRLQPHNSLSLFLAHTVYTHT